MDYGFDINTFCDNLDDGYGIFDDVCDRLDFAGVGISTTAPTEEVIQKTAETNKNKTVKNTVQGKRGKKPGQKGICSVCSETGHNKRTCTRK